MNESKLTKYYSDKPSIHCLKGHPIRLDVIPTTGKYFVDEVLWPAFYKASLDLFCAIFTLYVTKEETESIKT